MQTSKAMPQKLPLKPCGAGLTWLWGQGEHWILQHKPEYRQYLHLDCNGFRSSLFKLLKQLQYGSTITNYKLSCATDVKDLISD
jgi:hypothetical protein